MRLKKINTNSNIINYRRLEDRGIIRMQMLTTTPLRTQHHPTTATLDLEGTPFPIPGKLCGS